MAIPGWVDPFDNGQLSVSPTDTRVFRRNRGKKKA